MYLEVLSLHSFYNRLSRLAPHRCVVSEKRKLLILSDTSVKKSTVSKYFYSFIYNVGRLNPYLKLKSIRIFDLFIYVKDKVVTKFYTGCR